MCVSICFIFARSYWFYCNVYGILLLNQDQWSNVRCGCAPCKGGVLQWVRIPPGNSASDSDCGGAYYPIDAQRDVFERVATEVLPSLRDR